MSALHDPSERLHKHGQLWMSTKTCDRSVGLRSHVNKTIDPYNFCIQLNKQSLRLFLSALKSSSSSQETNSM
jgi:hypothetical protein